MKRKRILFVVQSLVCGGVEKALLNLCKALDKEQFDITVLEYDIWNNSVFRTQFIDAGIRVISPFSHLIPGKNIFHKAYNVISQALIEQAFKKKRFVFINEPFDLVVYYQLTTVKVVCRSRPNIISYIHGDTHTNSLYLLTANRDKKRLQSSKAVICVSNVARDSLALDLGLVDNTHVVYNIIDSHEIHTLSKEVVTNLHKRPYICAVGRLAVEKRFDMLIQIHYNILNHGIAHDLVIVGDGEMRPKLEQIITELNLNDSVHLVGFQSNPYPYINNSLFTVCSSETEGLHIASMESLCLGKPVVASFPTVQELFGDEQCGLITSVDRNSLEEGILQMLTDKKLYLSCCAAAKRRSHALSGSSMILKTENIYMDACK